MIEAVKQSVGSILSSGLTTVTGFLALVLMRFKIGPDMGWVMSKAIVLSLVSVLCFLPALAISTYRLIDKTQHRTFVPKFDKFAGLVMKLRIPALALVILILPVSFLGQMKTTSFMEEARYTAPRPHRWAVIWKLSIKCLVLPIR